MYFCHSYIVFVNTEWISPEPYGFLVAQKCISTNIAYDLLTQIGFVQNHIWISVVNSFSHIRGPLGPLFSTTGRARRALYVAEGHKPSAGDRKRGP